MYILRFDGGSRGNPGNAGSGAVIFLGIEKIWEGFQNVGITTNNVAEYSGLILGLNQAIKLGITELAIEGDSKLVIEQIKGTWKAKDAKMIELRNQALQLLKSIPTWTAKHIPRAENSVADALSNQAMNLA